MNNITLKQYASLPDASKYDVLEHILPCNEVNGKSMSIHKMPYVNVKHCLKLMQGLAGWEKMQQVFDICYNLEDDEFWHMKVTEFFGARNWILQEFKRVVTAESNVFGGKSAEDALWEAAGADRLKPYTDTLPLISLGKLLGQYPYDLGRKPYGEIFSLLVQTKTQAEVESEYQKLSIKK